MCFKLSASGSLRKEEVERERTTFTFCRRRRLPFLFIVYLTNKFVTKLRRLKDKRIFTLFFLYKNVVFPAQAEYSYFSADFRLKIFLYYS